MPNESSGKDLQIMYWSLLLQIAPSWRNLRHKVSTSVKLFLFILSSSPGHFLVNDLFTVSKQLAIRFQRNFTCTLMGSVRIAVQNLLTSRLTLTFQGHNYITSHFDPYLGFCWTNCCQILTQGSLGWGLPINKKTS